MQWCTKQGMGETSLGKQSYMAEPGRGREVRSWSELHWFRGMRKLTNSSIRLLLAILTTLGTHGWTIDNTVQAAGMQKLSHNVLFRHSPEIQSLSPAFFALSLPCELFVSRLILS